MTPEPAVRTPMITCQTCQQNVPVSELGCSCGDERFGLPQEAFEEVTRARQFPLIETARPAKRR